MRNAPPTSHSLAIGNNPIAQMDSNTISLIIMVILNNTSSGARLDRAPLESKGCHEYTPYGATVAGGVAALVAAGAGGGFWPGSASSARFS